MHTPTRGMAYYDPDIERVHRDFKEFIGRKNVTIIIAKAKPMTQAELESASRPRIHDYIGLIK